MRAYHIAILGASGAVGKDICQIFEAACIKAQCRLKDIVSR